MKIQFINQLGMSKTNKLLLEKVNSIIDDYAAQNYQLTLRQLYYQLVTRNIVANNTKEYDKLSNLITKGRLLGIVDWYAIVDRTRRPQIPYSNLSPEDAVRDAHDQYRLDRQNTQDSYVELWVEKDALSAVLARKTNHYHVNLMVNRGYSSTTAMFDSYQRYLSALERGKKTHILYLGDHDPSGLDMIRDIFARIIRMLGNQPMHIQRMVDEADQDFIVDLLNKWDTEIDNFETLCEEEYGGATFEYGREILAYIFEHFEVRHIGLTSEQIKQYNPPPNPAKMTDPRANWYVERFGRVSWEVDALEPSVLHSIIDENILSIIDIEKFNAVIEKENEDKAILKKLPEVRKSHEEIKIIVDNFDISYLMEPPSWSEQDKLKEMVEDFQKFFADIKSKF